MLLKLFPVHGGADSIQGELTSFDQGRNQLIDLMYAPEKILAAQLETVGTKFLTAFAVWLPRLIARRRVNI